MLLVRAVLGVLSCVGAILMVKSEFLGKWAFVVGIVAWVLFGIPCLFPWLLLFTGLF